MDAVGIQSRTVIKVVAIVIVAIGVAVLLNHVMVEIKTTIRWLCAAIFLALALSPLVDLIERARVRAVARLPRWAGDPDRLRPLRGRRSSSCPRRDPADRPRGRAARLAAADTTSRTSSTGPTTTSSSASSTTSTTSPSCSPRRPRRCPRSSATPRAPRRRSQSAPQQPGRGDRRAHARPSSCSSTAPRMFERSRRACAEPQRDARPPGRRADRRRSSAPTSRSTCCFAVSPASSPGSRWSCSASTSPFRSRSWSRCSTSCR